MKKQTNKKTLQCLKQTGHSLHIRYTLRIQTNGANQVKNIFFHKVVVNTSFLTFKSDVVEALKKLLSCIYSKHSIRNDVFKGIIDSKTKYDKLLSLVYPSALTVLILIESK